MTEPLKKTDLKELLLAADARTDSLTPPRRFIVVGSRRTSSNDGR